MKKIYPALLAVIIGLVSAVNLQADPFELILRGETTQLTTVTSNCDIVGSDFLLRFTGDTNNEANTSSSSPDQEISTYNVSPTGLLVDLEFTNRPNNQPDLIINDIETFLQVRDVSENATSSQVDRLVLSLTPVTEQSIFLNLRFTIELDGTTAFWTGPASAIPDLNFLAQENLASTLQIGTIGKGAPSEDNSNCGSESNLNFGLEETSFEVNISEAVAQDLPLMNFKSLLGLGILICGLALFFLFRLPGLRY
ncbi:MAG TPA: hypothetical protein VJ953_17955 [Saprospiraceae bacterium]|nr:hypothetical protein [Saprospiraceae bacterium]